MAHGELAMSVMYNMCAWCERTDQEIYVEDDLEDIEDALELTQIGDKRVSLCGRCRKLHAPNAKTDYEALLATPIDFPPGVTAIEHTCPELTFQGKSDEATFEMILTREGDYYTATCPHCGATVRSLADPTAF